MKEQSNLVIWLLTTILFVFGKVISAQTPEWEWAVSPDGGAISRSIDISDNNNIFLTGIFFEHLVFDSTTTLVSTGFGDVFIASYDEYSNLLWAKSAAGNYGDEGRCIVTASSGYIYVAGEFFSNNLTFDSITVINNRITPYFNDATKDIFLAKYDQSGKVIWVVSGGGLNMEFVRGITIDSEENITIAGTFWSSSVTFGSYSLDNTGNIDVFIVKFDSGGNVLWAKNPSGNDEENTYGVTADINGNLYVAGSFRSDSIIFGNISLKCSSEKFDAYIVEYDMNGNALWAENAIGDDWDEAKSVSIDNSGNIYITGHFQSDSIKFGAVTLYKSNPDNIDMFLVKYNPDHHVMWAQQSGGNIWSWVYPENIFVDLTDDIWITGSFIGNGLEFDSISLSTYGSYDIFAVKYNEQGNVFWAESIGGEAMDFSSGIKVDSSGYGYLTGFFESEHIMFGNITLSNTEYDNKIFLAKKKNKITTVNSPGLRNINQFSTLNDYQLFQNYPNPFNPSTKIRFSLTPSLSLRERVSEGRVRVFLKVYDVLGNEVTTLVNEELPAGEYEVEFNSTSGNRYLASGTYFYQLKVGDFIQIKKMVLLK